MKRTTWLALATGLLFVGPAKDVVAQGRGNNDRDRDREVRVEDRRDRDRDRDWNRSRDRNDRDWNEAERRRQRELEEILRRRRAAQNDRYDDRYDDRYKKNAPPFCRDGRGHPVHGRQWCREKGYGLGRDRDVWHRVTYGDVVYRRRSIHDGRMSRGTLSDILGAVLVGRFDSHSRSLGYREPLYGRWFEGGTVLQVTSGAYPVAQVIDRNRDGRADMIMLYR